MRSPVIMEGPGTGASEDASRALIDPRIAEVGGHRKSTKDTYDFPGMQDDTTWRRSRVHQSTSYNGCHRCGAKFTGPHAVYVHVAKRHGV